MNGGPENSERLYRIDAGRSNFTVQAFAVGLLSFMGHNPAFAVRRYGALPRFVGDLATASAGMDDWLEFLQSHLVKNQDLTEKI